MEEDQGSLPGLDLRGLQAFEFRKGEWFVERFGQLSQFGRNSFAVGSNDQLQREYFRVDEYDGQNSALREGQHKHVLVDHQVLDDFHLNCGEVLDVDLPRLLLELLQVFEEQHLVLVC